jgi:hypothetical protein
VLHQKLPQKLVGTMAAHQPAQAPSIVGGLSPNRLFDIKQQPTNLFATT